jgi:hypothetical protein
MLVLIVSPQLQQYLLKKMPWSSYLAHMTMDEPSLCLAVQRQLFECWHVYVVSMKQFGIGLTFDQYEYFWEDKFRWLKQTLFYAFIGVLSRERKDRIEMFRRMSRRARWGIRVPPPPRPPPARHSQ